MSKHGTRTAKHLRLPKTLQDETNKATFLFFFPGIGLSAVTAGREAVLFHHWISACSCFGRGLEVTGIIIAHSIDRSIDQLQRTIKLFEFAFSRIRNSCNTPITDQGQRRRRSCGSGAGAFMVCWLPTYQSSRNKPRL